MAKIDLRSWRLVGGVEGSAGSVNIEKLVKKAVGQREKSNPEYDFIAVQQKNTKKYKIYSKLKKPIMVTPVKLK